MGSFKPSAPSAPFIPDSYGGSAPPYGGSAPSYGGAGPYTNYNHDYPPPPPAATQTYHVSHESYSDNNYPPPPQPPQQPPPPTQTYHVAHESYSDSPPPPRPAQCYHVGHEPYSASSPYSSPPSHSHGGFGYGGGGFSGYNLFRAGTDPEVIRSFQMVDRITAASSKIMNSCSLSPPLTAGSVSALFDSSCSCSRTLMRILFVLVAELVVGMVGRGCWWF